MFGPVRFGASGCTSWMNWLRRPRLNSAVHRVAVLTCDSFSWVVSLRLISVVSRYPHRPARAARAFSIEADAPLRDHDFEALALLVGQRPGGRRAGGAAIMAEHLQGGLHAGHVGTVHLLGANRLELGHAVDQLHGARIIARFQRRMDGDGTLRPDIDQ